MINSSNIKKLGPKLTYDFISDEWNFIHSKSGKTENELKNINFDASPDTISLDEMKSIDEPNSKFPIYKIESSNYIVKKSNQVIEPKSDPNNLINLFKRAKNFVQKIKKNVFYGDIRNLIKYQYNFIDDPIYFKHGPQNKQSLKTLKFLRNIKIIKSVRKLFNRLYFHFPNANAIRPDNKIKKAWDFFLLLFTFFNFFAVSIDLCFSIKDAFAVNNSELSDYPKNEFVSYKIFMFLIYFLDIILCFMTGFHDMGKIVMNFNEIKNNYIKNHFIYDFLSLLGNLLFALELDYDLKYLNLFNALFFFIYNKFNDRLKNFNEFLLQEKEDIEEYFSIFFLYLKTIFISHLLACLWYIVGDYNSSHRDSWINYYELSGESWSTKYLNSLYFSLVTMLTVGYGDITPRNNLEKIICILTMLIGFTVFGFTLGSICDIIQKMNNKNLELKENSKVITRLMKKNNVEYDFQFRVRKYIEYIFLEEKDRRKEEEILNKLSKPIKEEFLNQIYGKIISSIPFFSKNFSVNCLKSIPLIVKKIDFSPEEILIKSYENQSQNFYFIFKGEVRTNLCKDKFFIHEKNHFSLKEKEYFNLFAFITNKPENLLVKTNKFCTFYTISHNEFVNLLRNDFPEDYEIFSKIKEQILFDNNYQNTYKNCLFCQNKDHEIFTCPFLHYFPNSDFIIKKHNYSLNCERKCFKRKIKFQDKINCLRYRQKIYYLVNKFRKNKEDIINDYAEKYLNYDKNTEEEDSFEESLNNIEIMKQDESMPFLKVENIEKENFKEKEIHKEINSESSQMISSTPKLKRRKSKKKTTILSETGKYKYISSHDFEPEFNLLISDNRKNNGLDAKINNKNLFDFDMDKSHDYVIYKPFYNFDNSLRRYLEYLKLIKSKRKNQQIKFKKSKLSSLSPPKFKDIQIN